MRKNIIITNDDDLPLHFDQISEQIAQATSFYPVKPPIPEESCSIYDPKKIYPFELVKTGNRIIKFVNTINFSGNYVDNIIYFLQSNQIDLNQPFNNYYHTTLTHFLANRGINITLLRALGANDTDIASGYAYRGDYKSVFYTIDTRASIIELSFITANYYWGGSNDHAEYLIQSFDNHNIYCTDIIYSGEQINRIRKYFPQYFHASNILNYLSTQNYQINDLFYSNNPSLQVSLAHYLAAQGHEIELLIQINSDINEVAAGYAFSGQKDKVKEILYEYSNLDTGKITHHARQGKLNKSDSKHLETLIKILDIYPYQLISISNKVITAISSFKSIDKIRSKLQYILTEHGLSSINDLFDNHDGYNFSLTHYLANKGYDHNFLLMLGGDISDIAAGYALSGQQIRVWQIIEQTSYVNLEEIITHYFLGGHDKFAEDLVRYKTSKTNPHLFFPDSLICLGQKIMKAICYTYESNKAVTTIQNILASEGTIDINQTFSFDQHITTLISYLAYCGIDLEILKELNANISDVSAGYALAGYKNRIDQIFQETSNCDIIRIQQNYRINGYTSLANNWDNYSNNDYDQFTDKTSIASFSRSSDSEHSISYYL